MTTVMLDVQTDNLTPREAAQLLGISRATLDRLRSAGRLPAGLECRVSDRRIVFSRRALEAWKAQGGLLAGNGAKGKKKR